MSFEFINNWQLFNPLIFIRPPETSNCDPHKTMRNHFFGPSTTLPFIDNNVGYSAPIFMIFSPVGY